MKSNNDEAKQNEQKQFERIWNNELTRWSDFINTIKKSPTVNVYRGYNIKGVNKSNSRTISLSENLQIEFAYNPSVEYIEYQYTHTPGYSFSRMACICKYKKGDYGISILYDHYFEVIPFKEASPSTLVEMVLLETYRLVKYDPMQIHACALKKLLVLLEKDFKIELNQFEKKAISALDPVIQQHDKAVESYLCEG